MELTLLGTGAPDGLPRPHCPCAACATARGPFARAATALLVDGALLLDLTPGAALAAARAGHSLNGVRQVLLTHPHDGPPVELPAGLPTAGRVADGRVLTLISGHRVRAVPMDSPGTGYEVTAPGGERLLYLPPGGAPAGLPTGNGNGDAAAGTGRSGARSARDAAPAPYDMLLADVIGRPDAAARLRAAGSVGPTTDVIAVHIGHDVPPGDELDRRLAAAGARAVPDGTTLTVGEYHAVPDLPRRTLVTAARAPGSPTRRSGGWPRSPACCTWRRAARGRATRSGGPGSWRTATAGRGPGGPPRPATWRRCSPVRARPCSSTVCRCG